MTNTNSALDDLVSLGLIEGYQILDVSGDGALDEPSLFRNTQRLSISFPQGKVLTIGAFCSGSSENTELIIS